MQPTNSESNPKCSFQDNPVRAVGARLRAHKCVLNVWPRVEFPNLREFWVSLSACLRLCRSLSLSVCLRVFFQSL